MTTHTAAEALEEVLARAKRAIEGPYFVALDDAEDTSEHRNSGLALIETGRQSDWPVARLCEWETAYFIAAMEGFIRTHADTLRAALATPQPLTDAQIVEIRDDHLPSQGEPFDCIAFARAVLRATQSAARDDWKAAAKYSTDCHAAEAESEFRRPVATVVNNNQPHWTAIIETAPNVTLNVGTKLYLAPQSNNGRLAVDGHGSYPGDGLTPSESRCPKAGSTPVGGESPAPSTPAQEGEATREQIDAGWVADLAYEDELKNAGYTHADRRERVRRILRAARLLRATQSNDPGGWQERERVLYGESPAQTTPAQEPVAWYDPADFTRTTSQRTEKEYAPLYAAPQPDEARAWFDLLFRARETIRIGMAFINDSQEERDNWIGHGQMMDEEISAYLEKHK